MKVLVVLLCGLAAVLVLIALAGPERWHRKWHARVRPGAPEPTDSGYKLLFWRNWFAAAAVTALAVVAVDQVVLSERELYDAAARAVDTMDGTTGQVTSDRIESLVETAVRAELAVREVDSDSTERTDPDRYEIFEGELVEDQKPAVCVEVQRIGGTADHPVAYSYTSISQGPCT